jgi:FtsH-binding integral membrane protein
MSFLEDALKDAVKAAADAYKENGRIAALLDDKAQQTGGLAGIFLAAAFGFVNPSQGHALILSYGRYSEPLVIGSVIFFILCLAVCLSVMWVRATPSPMSANDIRDMISDMALVPEAELTDEVRRNFYMLQLDAWKKILEMQRKSNIRKGRLLFSAQSLVGAGMLFVAVLLIRIVSLKP